VFFDVKPQKLKSLFHAERKTRAGQEVDFHHADHPIDVIKVIGSIALVFGEMHANITAGGVRKILHNKVLAVWERHDGDWKLLAYQPTPIPQ